MKRTVLAVSLFWGCMYVGSAWAVDLTLFEQDFLRGKGKPDSYGESFVAQAHEAKVIISSGSDDKKHRVSSASVLLNGKKIADSRDFKKKVYQKEVTVDLLESNTVSVRIAGKPGSLLNVRVIQEIDADAADVVGPEGGVVAVEDVESPIYGARIEVPAGALDEDIVLTMEEAELSHALPEGVTFIGPAIDFGPDGTVFNNEALITFPYADADNSGYIDGTEIYEENLIALTDSSGWEYLTEKGHDLSSNNITFSASHFSTFTLAATPITVSNLTVVRQNWYQLFKANQGIQLEVDTDHPVDSEFIKIRLFFYNGTTQRMSILFTKQNNGKLTGKIPSSVLSEYVAERDREDKKDEFSIVTLENDDTGWFGLGAAFGLKLKEEIESLLGGDCFVSLASSTGDQSKGIPPATLDYLSSAGFETIRIEIEDSANVESENNTSNTVFFENQADWMIYTGHGFSSISSIIIRDNDELNKQICVGPKEEKYRELLTSSMTCGASLEEYDLVSHWRNNDLDGILLFACAMMDIHDFGRKYGNNPPSPGLEWAADIDTIDGLGTNGPKTLLGFTHYGPTINGNNGGDFIIDTWLPNWLLTNSQGYKENASFLSSWKNSEFAPSVGMGAINLENDEYYYYCGVEDQYEEKLTWRKIPVKNLERLKDEAPAHSWYFEPLNKMLTEGIMEGYINHDNKLLPANNITKAEILKMVLAAAKQYDSGYSSSACAAYPECSNGQWYNAPVGKGFDLGWITFPYNPNELATRGFVASLIAKAKATPDEVKTLCKRENFPDVKGEEDPYYCDILYCKEKKIFTGYEDGFFRSGRLVNRAEAAKVICEAFFENDCSSIID